MLAMSSSFDPLRGNLTPSSKKRIQDYVFEVDNPIGKGNFSTVYAGAHLSSKQSVAVKVIKMSTINNRKLEQLLEQEIDIVCSLNHINIIRCYQVLKSVNHCYLVTELCSQGTLESFLKNKSKLTEQELWPYALGIFQGLKYLSQQGIVHRDLKTANVFLKEGVPKIADFGFAARARNHFKDMNIGSPLYMAPEAYIFNLYGPKTDVWAFGVILFELTHGRTPSSHCTSELDLRRSLERGVGESELRRDLSPQLRELILRCLMVDEAKRISVDQIQQLGYFKRNVALNQQITFSCDGNRKTNINIPQFIKGRLESGKNRAINIKLCEIHENDRIIQKKQNKTGSQGRIQFETNKSRANDKMLTPEKGTFSGWLIMKPEGARSVDQLTRRGNWVQPNRLEPAKRMGSEADSTDQSSKESKVNEKAEFLAGRISFNQSIGLIHFCRIGFKLMSEEISSTLKGMIRQLILQVLRDMLVKVDNDCINYEVNEARESKQKKLKLVITEYLTKYNASNVANGNLQQLNLSKIANCGEEDLSRVEEKLQIEQKGFFQTYLLRIFIRFSKELDQGIVAQCYRKFSQSSILESCLYEKSSLTNMSQYRQFVEKLLVL